MTSNNNPANQMEAVPGPMPHTEEWYALRKYDPEREKHRVVFGGSEAAEVVNQSPYSTGPLEVYLKKRGEMESPDLQSRRGVRMGSKLEPIILAEYAEETGNTVYDGQPMFFHGSHDFMAVTPDAVAVPAADVNGRPRGVESKASTHHMRDSSSSDINKFGRPGTDEVPMVYNWQCQQLMGVLGYVTVDIPVFFSIHQLDVYTVPRNDDMIDALVSAQKELAERIVNGDPPEPNWEHEKTREVLRNMHGFVPESRCVLDYEAITHWREYQQLGETIKEHEKARRGHAAKLLDAMGSYELGALPSEGGVDYEVRVCRIADSIVTQEDVDAMASKIGGIKRKGHEKLLKRKVKVKK